MVLHKGSHHRDSVTNLSKTMVFWVHPAVFSHLMQGQSREELFYRFGSFTREYCRKRKGKKAGGYIEREFL